MNTKERLSMKNITINIPDIYDVNIEKLIKQGIIRNRSEGIRLALKEFLQKEFSENLGLLKFNGGVSN
ncbi:MAG: ribbon-helix-helix domain-containing protein [Promethearchaeia archaeon]